MIRKTRQHNDGHTICPTELQNRKSAVCWKLSLPITASVLVISWNVNISIYKCYSALLSPKRFMRMMSFVYSGPLTCLAANPAQVAMRLAAQSRESCARFAHSGSVSQSRPAEPTPSRQRQVRASSLFEQTCLLPERIPLLINGDEAADSMAVWNTCWGEAYGNDICSRAGLRCDFSFL